MTIIKLESTWAKAQKKSALRLLRKLNAELPSGGTCYIAGGATRDWQHGWGCRDVDIFYHVPDQPDWIPQSFRKIEFDTVQGYTGPYKTNYINNVAEYTCTTGNLQYRPIQFINVDEDPLKVIKNFPISISRIWMGIDGKIECDWAYDMSIRSKAIHEMNRDQWNYHYLEKILGRFSDYAFIPHLWKQA